jgi:hypothetical protein
LNRVAPRARHTGNPHNYWAIAPATSRFTRAVSPRSRSATFRDMADDEPEWGDASDLDEMEAVAREHGGVLAMHWVEEHQAFVPVVARVVGPEEGRPQALHLGDEVYLLRPGDLSKLLLDLQVIPDEPDD